MKKSNHDVARYETVLPITTRQVSTQVDKIMYFSLEITTKMSIFLCLQSFVMKTYNHSFYFRVYHNYNNVLISSIGSSLRFTIVVRSYIPTLSFIFKNKNTWFSKIGALYFWSHFQVRFNQSQCHYFTRFLCCENHRHKSYCVFICTPN